jgi:siroheme decarboxylase
MKYSEATAMDEALLVRLQEGLPLVERPFAALGQELGVEEREVLGRVQSLIESGRARRLGAVFDARRLGYRSILCAARVADPTRMEMLAASLAPYPGITHCYERGWPAELSADLPGSPGEETWPNLWFTFAEMADRFDSQWNAIRQLAQPQELFALPARTRFKIDVIFGNRERRERFPGSARAPGEGETVAEIPATFTEEERHLVRRMEGHMSAAADFFRPVADELGWPLDRLLRRLSEWQTAGVLRRVGVIVRHRQLGYTANAMCVWRVPDDDVARAGRALAVRPEVTHCYERASAAAFPYNLYAMIHTPSWEATHGLFLEIGREAGLSVGRMLGSMREFKKDSMHYFAETSRVGEHS